MSTYFNAYPVTADMGLRESINAMLSHVAYARHDFGYMPTIEGEANHKDLQDDFSGLLVSDNGILMLADIVYFSEALADLVGILEELCNDYPVYNDETYSEIEWERTAEMIEDSLRDLMDESDIPVDFIMGAIHELGLYVEQSEYGAWMSEEDFAVAVEHGRLLHVKYLGEIHGQMELDI